MTDIDRLAPTRRPPGPAAGTQKWRHLLFLHWPVPVEALRPLVPSRLSLDLHDGVAYVGLVPFAMEDVRPAWVPRPLALDFLETNVRTYVHFEGRDPGVWFLSLDAASRLAVHAARLGWHLPYHYARMDMRLGEAGITYECARATPARPRLRARYRPGDPLPASAPGSLQFFLLERYILYAERNGRLFTGRVHHRPYPAYAAEVHEVTDDLVAAAGLPRPAGPPLAHYSPGVDVEVFALHREV
jgi:uncharacterized protein YqjF (DUF2071 family)